MRWRLSRWKGPPHIGKTEAQILIENKPRIRDTNNILNNLNRVIYEIMNSTIMKGIYTTLLRDS